MTIISLFLPHVGPVAVPETIPEKRLNEEDVPVVLPLIYTYSSKWRLIGMGLGFTNSELNLISSKPSLYATAPASYVEELLSQWVQWPVDKHPTEPTLMGLCKALRSSPVNLGKLAQDVEREVRIAHGEQLPKDSTLKRVKKRISSVFSHNQQN